MTAAYDRYRQLITTYDDLHASSPNAPSLVSRDDVSCRATIREIPAGHRCVSRPGAHSRMMLSRFSRTRSAGSPIEGE